MKVVIIGGVAGGATAAARIRRLDEGAQIVAFERTGYVSYANCGLPYYVGGEITDSAALTLQTPAQFWERYRVDVRVRHEAVSIDTAHKTVTVHGLDTGKTYEEAYDKLLLSPGAKPVIPPMPGIHGERIFTLRTVEDTLAIRAFVEKQKPQSATIIGGGFIGLEMAENLRGLGLSVAIVERLPQLMAPLDRDMAALIHAKFRKEGVRLLLGTSVTGVEPNGDTVTTRLEGAQALSSDMVLLAIGVAPDTQLAKNAGLTLGARGSIAVNEHMQTSEPDIYAVGDAVEITHFVTGAKALIALAGPANKQARIAADNICGLDSRYSGAQGSSVLKVFDMTAATTGVNEQVAKAAGMDYERIVLSPMSHASYYPGGKVLTMKLLYDRKTEHLLGAQIVGYDGVDKRIDVLATAMRAGLSVMELSRLDLAYAPPYSSAKDPVNMAGYMAENIKDGLVKQFHWDEVDKLPHDGSVTLLDTRTPAEYERGHADGFVNIPLDDLRERIGELAKGKPVYVMCQSGLRSYLACRVLCQNGYDCYNFSGGYRFYESIRKDRLAADAAYPCGMDQ